MLKVQESFAQQMIAHAREEDPKECCGVLAGTKEEYLKLFRMTNVDASPYRFSWDAKELFQVWRRYARLALVPNPPDASTCLVSFRMVSRHFVVRNNLVVPVGHIQTAVRAEL